MIGEERDKIAEIRELRGRMREELAASPGREGRARAHKLAADALGEDRLTWREFRLLLEGMGLWTKR